MFNSSAVNLLFGVRHTVPALLMQLHIPSVFILSICFGPCKQHALFVSGLMLFFSFEAPVAAGLCMTTVHDNSGVTDKLSAVHAD